MEVTFWGVRGSYPVPGAGTVRYGGQTSCVEVRSRSGACLVIDAGTGLRALGQKLAREQGNASSWHYHFVLSHVHWDHIQGLPFFEPAYIPGTSISIYALRAAADELQQVIGGITRHEFFPMPLESVPAKFKFNEVTPGEKLAIFDFNVVPIALNHPFGAVGYRVTADGASLAYVADTAPFDKVLHKQHFLDGPEELSDEDRATLEAMERDLVAAITDTHTVIYDTHFFPEEYEKLPHYGHSSPEHALELCSNIGVKRLILYHHAPSHTDDMMDEITARYRVRGAERGLEVVAAAERLTLKVGRSREATSPGVVV
jgi:phosphoribosyl 1,2-cyclic phosphodiesterase